MVFWPRRASFVSRLFRSWPVLLLLSSLLLLALVVLVAQRQVVAQTAPPALPFSTVPPLPTLAPVTDAPTDAPNSAAVAATDDATPTQVEGILSIVHVDDFENQRHARLYRLNRDGGASLWLNMDDAWFDAQGGMPHFDGKRVLVTLAEPDAEAEAAAAPSTPVQVAALALASAAAANAETVLSSPAVGAASTLRYVNLLCRFADQSADLPSAASIAEWSTGSYAHFDHFFSQASYGGLQLQFATVSEWRTLPMLDSSLQGSQEFVDSVTEKCTQLFADQVDFGNFDGVQIFTNSDIQSAAGYGTWFMPITVQGETHNMRVTWFMNACGNCPGTVFMHHVVVHELGHSLGQLHSNNSDGDASPYDNAWDLMSAGGECFLSAPSGIDQNCIGIDMIAPHKLDQGWIAPSRIYTLTAGTDATIALDWLSLGGTTSNYVVVEIPVSDDKYFTVEARTRQTTGYDKTLAGESGVIIHEVNELRNEPAWQVGATSDANSIAGGGVWLPGETYVNDQWQFSIQVLESTGSGYRLRLRHTGTPPVSIPELSLFMRTYEGDSATDTIGFAAQNLGGWARNVKLRLDYTASALSGSGWPMPTANAQLLVVGSQGTTCTGETTIICTLADVAPQRQREFSITYRASESARYDTVWTLSADGFVPSGSEHIETIETELIAYPDLATQITPALATFANGQGALDFVFGNTGMTMPTVTMAITLPVALAVQDMQLTQTGLQATCQIAAPGVRCTSASMPHRATLRVRLQLHPSSLYQSGRYTPAAAAWQTAGAGWQQEEEYSAANNRAQSLLCAGFCSPQGAASSTVFLSSVRKR